jgi:hypothetical protein
LQAYMRRSLEDVQNIVRAGFSVRLCKGIYDEPGSIAYKDFDTVRQNYIFLLDGLLKGGIYVGIATHDEYLIWHALRLIHQLEIPKDRYEFQMLLGVDEELRGILVDAGHKLRVYVPFGEDWYEYSTRPLKENPKIYPGFAVGEDVHLTMRMPLYQRLLSAGVTFVPNSNVSALDGSEVKVRNIYTGEEHGVEQVDTLVTWLGSRAHDDFWHALKGQVGELYAAGDCLAPRSVEAAMTEGAEIARSL